VAGPLLDNPAADRANWTLARLAREVERRRTEDQPLAAFQGAQTGGFVRKRPRHTLKRRQDADALDRSDLRLRLLKGDVTLLFADESEALTHPSLSRAWGRRGADLRIPAPGHAKKVAMMGALDYATGRLSVTTSRTRRSSDFIALLAELGQLYGPKPGRADKPVLLVLDNGPVHTSKATRGALDDRAHWLTVEWLPKYAPELTELEPGLEGAQVDGTCASDLHRRRPPRPGNPPRCRKPEPRTLRASVDEAGNLW
jgi:hypothetical protein